MTEEAGASVFAPDCGGAGAHFAYDKNRAAVKARFW
jgi:hypothetical protein